MRDFSSIKAYFSKIIYAYVQSVLDIRFFFITFVLKYMLKQWNKHFWLFGYAALQA